MKTATINKLIEKLFDISKSIRYVAIYQNNELISKQRNELIEASDAESDKYEELFVNPTILKIANQRGNIDCGGLNFVLIRYANFYQLVQDYKHGHISICIEKEVNPLELEIQIKNVLYNSI